MRLKRSMARSRLRNDRWLFSTRLLAQRPISCFSALPSSFIAALWRWSAFFMKVSAASSSRVFVM
jgi:hypothetical protein